MKYLRFAALLVCLLCFGIACAGNNSHRKDPVRMIELALPPNTEARLLQRLTVFAVDDHFEWWTNTLSSDMGTSRQFQMQRRDVEIIGMNGVREYGPYPPLTPEGYPDEQIDPNKYRVYFYEGRERPTELAISGAVNDFTRIVAIEGIVATVSTPSAH